MHYLHSQIHEAHHDCYIFIGKFYLGDAGFQLKSGLLTPYRGVRYHLKEYSNHAPQNPKEIFNSWSGIAWDPSTQ